MEGADAPAGTLRLVQEPPVLLAHRQFRRASLRRSDRVHRVESVLPVAERGTPLESYGGWRSGELPERRRRQPSVALREQLRQPARRIGGTAAPYFKSYARERTTGKGA